MKKLSAISLTLILLSFAVSAQRPRLINNPVRPTLVNATVDAARLVEFRREQLRYIDLQRRAFRDGIITPHEKRKLNKIKRRTLQKSYRLNGRVSKN